MVEYGANEDETCMNENWFYATKLVGFGDEGNATKWSPPEQLPKLKVF